MVVYRYRWMIPNLYFWEMVGNHQPSIKKNGGLPGHWSTAARQYEKARLPNINCAVYRAELFFCRLAWQQKLGRFLFSSQNLGNWSNLTDIVQMGWFNHQLENFLKSIFFQWFEILSWMVNLTTWKKLETIIHPSCRNVGCIYILVLCFLRWIEMNGICWRFKM